jgi:hypothetical protein
LNGLAAWSHEKCRLCWARSHESCLLCTMENVAFPAFEPWKTSPLTMRNVALSCRAVGIHEKCRFGSAENKLPLLRSYEAQNGTYLALLPRRGFIVENVALNHEKRRHCRFSSGDQERRRIIPKKEKDEERKSSSSDFCYFFGTNQNKNGFLAQHLQGFKLKLSASLSAGRYEDRAAKLVQPHSR